MYHKRLLQKLISLMLAVLLLIACGPGSLLQPTPTPTPTPAAGIGVPITGRGWQITIEGTRQEAELTRSRLDLDGGRLSFSTSTYYPRDGHTFLVVEGKFRNFDPVQRIEIAAKDVTVIGENGESFETDDLSDPPGEFVFQIEEDDIN